MDQQRTGALYTWAKQYQARSLVQGTPTGQRLAASLRQIEAQELRLYRPLGPVEDDEAKVLALLKVLDDGGVLDARTPRLPPERNANGQVVLESDESRLAKLENIAVDMARKQQELVAALTVAEERQRSLHGDLVGLRSGPRAEVVAINDSTTTLV